MNHEELEEQCAYPKCELYEQGCRFDINPHSNKPYLCPCKRHLLDKRHIADRKPSTNTLPKDWNDDLPDLDNNF